MKKVSVLLLVLLAGCSEFDTDMASMGRSISGSHFQVTLYSGSQAVRTWEVRGKVNSEQGSDGWYFVDIHGQYVEIAGAVVIEEIK